MDWRPRNYDWICCRDNEQFLPQEYYLSRELNRFVFDKYPYDGKTQVTMNGNS